MIIGKGFSFTVIFIDEFSTGRFFPNKVTVSPEAAFIGLIEIILVELSWVDVLLQPDKNKRTTDDKKIKREKRLFFFIKAIGFWGINKRQLKL
jgi:hypothetical protein